MADLIRESGHCLAELRRRLHLEVYSGAIRIAEADGHWVVGRLLVVDGVRRRPCCRLGVMDRVYLVLLFAASRGRVG